jgi:hypothetical protein
MHCPLSCAVQRLLQHKVAQHHLLQTNTALINGTPRVTARRPLRPLGDAATQQPAAAPDVAAPAPAPAAPATPAVVKLADVDVAAVKMAPKALIRRPPSANSMRGMDGAGQQQSQQQRKKSHKEREQGACACVCVCVWVGGCARACVRRGGGCWGRCCASCCVGVVRVAVHAHKSTT